jgi:hypothetical protein
VCVFFVCFEFLFTVWLFAQVAVQQPLTSETLLVVFLWSSLITGFRVVLFEIGFMRAVKNTGKAWTVMSG